MTGLSLILVPFDCKSGLLQSLDLRSLPHERSIAYSRRYLYIFLDILFITLDVCEMIVMASQRWLAFGFRSLSGGSFTF